MRNIVLATVALFVAVPACTSEGTCVDRILDQSTNGQLVFVGVDTAYVRSPAHAAGNDAGAAHNAADASATEASDAGNTDASDGTDDYASDAHATPRSVIATDRFWLGDASDGHLYVHASGTDTSTSSVTVTMLAPPRPGSYTLTELDAYACDDLACPVTREDPLTVCNPSFSCTALSGRLEVTTYDRGCVSRDEACTQLAFALALDAPATLPRGPIVYGRTTVVQRYESHSRECTRGCGGARGTFSPE